MITFPYAFLGWFWSVYVGWLIYDQSGGDWMGFKRVKFVSEEEKREHKAKERIKQFVKYKAKEDLKNKGGEKDEGAESEYWKAQFMKHEMPELDDDSGTEYWANLLSIYRQGKKKKETEEKKKDNTKELRTQNSGKQLKSPKNPKKKERREKK